MIGWPSIIAAAIVEIGQTEPEKQRVTDQLLAALTAQARQEKPRFFAICGVYEDPPVLGDEARTYVEWGLEFPGRSIAITWSPGGLTTSSSAQQILDSNAVMGPARLIWLE